MKKIIKNENDLKKIKTNENLTLVFDLGETMFLSSVAVAAVIKIGEELEEKGYYFKIITKTEAIYFVFELTGVCALFNVELII